jgi:predicted DNA-binding transcriptional regulator YafY
MSRFCRTLDLVRASRLVELLLLLQVRGRAPATELAARLEVSVRTIYRDVEALAAAGVPLYSEPGRNGGIRLSNDYRMGSPRLDDAESRAALAAAVPSVARDLDLDAAGERLLIEPGDWFKRRDEVPALVDVARGVWECRELRIGYRSAARESTRVIRPLGLVLKGDAWYVLARSRRGGDRVYRISRIDEVTLLPHRFDRPNGFDLSAAWTHRKQEFTASIPRYDARVRVAPDAERLLAVLQEGTPSLPLPPETPRDRDGWAELRLRFERPESAARLLLQLGAGIEVLDPPELRTLMRTHAESLHALYRT